MQDTTRKDKRVEDQSPNDNIYLDEIEKDKTKEISLTSLNFPIPVFLLIDVYEKILDYLTIKELKVS